VTFTSVAHALEAFKARVPATTARKATRCLGLHEMAPFQRSMMSCRSRGRSASSPRRGARDGVGADLGELEEPAGVDLVDLAGAAGVDPVPHLLETDGPLVGRLRRFRGRLVADDGHPRRPPRDALALKLADAGALLGGGVHGEADRGGELALVEVVGNRHRADLIPRATFSANHAVITWSLASGGTTTREVVVHRRVDVGLLAGFELVEALGVGLGFSDGLHAAVRLDEGLERFRSISGTGTTGSIAPPGLTGTGSRVSGWVAWTWRIRPERFSNSRSQWGQGIMRTPR
jgi:hypothetical protein